jgi:hypothetical protein
MFVIRMICGMGGLCPPDGITKRFRGTSGPQIFILRSPYITVRIIALQIPHQLIKLQGRICLVTDIDTQLFLGAMQVGLNSH